MVHFKYIFFDLDGTLVDSSQGIKESFHYAFKKLNQETPDDKILRSFMGPPLEVSFASVLKADQVAAAIHHYRSFYKEKGIYGVRLYEGIPELLSRLNEAGCQIFVTTSKNEPTAHDLLSNLGIDRQFEQIFGALPDSFHKADVLRRALKTIKAAPEEAVIVGDTKFDIIGGKEVDLSTVGVLWGFGSQTELIEYGADKLVDSPQELLSILVQT
ncbi:HAD hydrolase-like protein [Streptococcus panodentis]|uniref:Phosphoglycolate phosphatase n=1 Tax=Streptococcus panodentis TaxID=1581472 RepID=A0ABS5AUJ9_9STRE|nr:HAD hydrolase-like protein [Streptococcus panodentis]MBP2620252.1 phosphoglycolate phosphatase [Streptococcus panodentis]